METVSMSGDQVPPEEPKTPKADPTVPSKRGPRKRVTAPKQSAEAGEAKPVKAKQDGKGKPNGAGEQVKAATAAQVPQEDPKAEYGSSPKEEKPLEPDPFDPTRFRTAGTTAAAAAQRVWTDGQISVRKPNDQEWFRARTGLDEEGQPWSMPASLIRRRLDGKFRLIDPDIAPAVRQAKPHILHFCITIEGSPLVYPIPEPGLDGRDDGYWETARGIVTEAESQWIRMWADQAAGVYLSERARKDFGAGKWESTPPLVRLWLKIAFGKDGFIRNLDHPELLRMRGEG
jgi:hypothetical protein